MSQALPQLWTVADVPAFEVRPSERYKLVDRIVRAVVGGSNAHTLTRSDVFAALHADLRSGSAARWLGTDRRGRG